MSSPTPDGLWLKAYKYKLYPTKAQRQLMHETTFLCSLVYNQCLAQRKNSWEKEQKSVSCYAQIKQLTNLFLSV
jgi:putative transposase